MRLTLGSLVMTAMAVLAFATVGATAATIGHDHFVSDPYPDNWCGIAGTSVDNVVANYTLDGSRTSLNVVTTFTATGSGKSMLIRDVGLRSQGAPVYSADGTTYTVTFTNAGPSPMFMLPTGQVIVDTGLFEGVATFDSATGEFVSFEIVKSVGSRPPGCDAIIAALS